MYGRSFLQKLKMTWLCYLRAFHAAMLARWIFYSQSQVLPVNQKSAIVFSPHQDDETLGCGGAIALKRDRGVAVKVVFLTDGKGSHRSSPMQADKLNQVRKQEALTALQILGIDPTDISFLDLPDGQLQNLSKSQHQYAIDQLTQLIQSFQPGEIYVPHRQDRHQDHEATYQLVREAIALSSIQTNLLQYPIWIFWQAPLLLKLKLDELQGAYRLSIEPVQARKNRAIAAYRSQYLPLDSSTNSALPRGFLKQFFLPYEIFFQTTEKSARSL